MKEKMVKYMINREINPIEFADLVDMNAPLPAKKEALKSKMTSKDIGMAEIFVAFAILIVIAFFVAMFLQNFSSPS